MTESEKILGRWNEYCADMYSGDSQINTSLDTGITSEQEDAKLNGLLILSKTGKAQCVTIFTRK